MFLSDMKKKGPLFGYGVRQVEETSKLEHETSNWRGGYAFQDSWNNTRLMKSTK